MPELPQDLTPELFAPLLHLLALAAGVLIALCGSRARRIISLLLALLWLWLGFWKGFSPIGSLLFFAEAFLLLVLGVVFGQIDFSTRAGWRPLVGGVLIAYSLLIGPFVPPLAELAVGFPDTRFPIVVFTVGALLFLRLPDRLHREKPEPGWKKWISRPLFLVPLGWCFIGGMAVWRVGWWRDPGLSVALLACMAATLLPLPKREPWSGVEHHFHEESWVERCYRWRLPFGAALLALWPAALFLFDRGRNDAVMLELAISVGLLTVIATAFWLALPAWFLPSFRTFAWHSARFARRFREGGSQVASRAGPLLILILVAGMAWAAREWAEGQPDSDLETSLLFLAAAPLVLGAIYAVYRARRSIAILLVLAALAVLAWAGLALIRQSDQEGLNTPLLAAASAPLVLGAVYAMYRARRSIVIFDFLNYSGTPELSECGSGLASRLHNELARISELYGTMEEILPSPRAEVVPLDVKVQDSLESLSDVVGPDASAMSKFGVPLELLIRVMGRLVNGPHLTGGLHRQGDDYVLVADLAGGRVAGTWQVCSRDLPEKDRKQSPSQVVYLLVERLAYMIVTTIGHVGSSRWEAVFHFTRALEAYRRTRGALEGRNAGLRQAEQELIRALSKDHGFVQCHYNLGVVYEDLEEHDSAEATFRHILKDHPDWPEVYYALANLYSEIAENGDDERCRRARRLANLFSLRALECQSRDTRAWNLYGHLRFGELLERWKDNLEQSEEMDEPVRAFEIAVALKWRSLCRSAVRSSGRSLEKQRRLALIYLNNLSIARLRRGESRKRFAESRSASREALLLSPHYARNHLVLGECFLREGLSAESLNASYCSFGDALSSEWDLERWAYVTSAHQESGHEEEVQRASARVLDSLVLPESIVLVNAENPERQRDDYRMHLDRCQRALDEGIKKTSPSNVRALQIIQALRELAEERCETALGREPWFEAQQRIFRAWRCLDEDPSAARKLLHEAITTLSEECVFSSQVRNQGLHSLLAKACLAEGLRENDPDALIEALKKARLSVSQKPESAARRWILAEVFSALGDIREAQSQMQAALRLGGGPELLGNDRTVHRVGEESLRLAEVAGGKTRRRILEESHGSMKAILELLESRKGSDPKAHAAAHFWVGRCQAELGRLEDATINLEIARAMGCRPVEATLCLADLHCRKGIPVEAEKVLQLALRKVDRQTESVRHNGAAPPEKVSPKLEARLRLAWALFSAEVRHDLESARQQVWKAGALIPRDDPELFSLHHECLGWIYLCEGHFAKSRKYLERAAKLQVSAGVNRRLAYVCERISQDAFIWQVQRVDGVRQTRDRARRLAADGAPGRGIFDLGLPPPVSQQPAQRASAPHGTLASRT